MKPIVLGILPLILAAGAGTVGAATEVNTCGQTFSGNGYLSGDLDCSAFMGDAVVINGGTLDLRGFSVTAGPVEGDRGVRCLRNCRVVSNPAGGEIRDAGGIGIFASSSGSNAVSVKVENVSVLGSAFQAISASGRVTVISSTISGSMSSSAILGDSSKVKRIVDSTITNVRRVVTGRAKVIDSEINGCIDECLNLESGVVLRSIVSGAGAAGVLAQRLRVIESMILDNVGDGVEGLTNVAKIRVVGSTIVNNGGRGVSGGGNPFLAKDSDISGNALEGVHYRGRVRLFRSTVTGNGRSGFSNTGSPTTCPVPAASEPVRLVASTVIGNGTDGAVCGVSETCADLTTCNAPAILTQGSTCETSYDPDSGFPGTSWGICSLD